MERPDLLDLQVEKIKIVILATIEVNHLLSRRAVALMAVLLTLSGTALVAGLADQVPLELALPLSVSLTALAGREAARLKDLAFQVKRAVSEGLRSVDRLITAEGEPDGDASEADP